MYSTPATGTSQNTNELEDYLLGKKRVDKMLTADENDKIGAAHKNFIAVQNANSARDIAAKIREDPLLAIKQQEQAAYQALMSNPLRLREMQERNGIKPKKDKEKKREKHEKNRRRDRSRTRTLSPDNRYVSRSDRRPSPYDRRSRTRRSLSPWDQSAPLRARSRSPDRSAHYADHRSKRRRSRSTETPHGKRTRYSPPAHPRPAPTRSSRPSNAANKAYDGADDRAARLAAMSSSASGLEVERQQRLATIRAKEEAELNAEEKARAKSKGMGGFLSNEQKKVYNGGLEERIRRGRGGMVVDAD